MRRIWASPLYEYDRGKLVIDVTSSISAGLPPHRCIASRVLPLARSLPQRRILDFGAGALRHTLPLLKSDFEVCAVEYEQAFEREEASAMLQRAKRRAHFSKLIWPREFQSDGRRFDAAILSFVLQVIPEPNERDLVIKHIARKLVDGGVLVYMSRVGQITSEMESRPLKDGYWMWPARECHSFYTEFTHENTHSMMARHKFIREASWSEGGKEQVFLYRKRTGAWG